MSVYIDLKPGEKCIIGGAVIKNDKDMHIKFTVENAEKVCILREKAIMSADQVDTPCKGLYFALQLAYIDPEKRDLHRKTYMSMIQSIKIASPSLIDLVDTVEKCLDGDQFYYRAMRLTIKLIEAEKVLLGADCRVEEVSYA